MDLHAVRSEMPVSSRWIYLNHAAVAPLSRPAARAMRLLVHDAEENGMVNCDQWSQLYSRARGSVAALIGARAEEIAFLKNTTDGLLAVANGINWQRGDNVVLPEREFPANVYPWLNLRERQVEVRWVPERDGRLQLEDFATAIDGNTRVLAVSSVEFLSGFRNDLRQLGQLCRQRDLLFVVDAIQSLGAFPLDVADLGIDCLAADGHKWLLGPEGCALFYCSRRALKQLQVSALGWAGVASAYDFLSYDTALYPDARRFETGTQNTAGIAGLKGAVDFLLDLGIPAIASRILELTDHLCAGLQAKGYQLLSSRRGEERSGIVTFSSLRHRSEDLYQALRSGGVITSLRGGYLRLAPHFYNTADELDRALHLLPTIP